MAKKTEKLNHTWNKIMWRNHDDQSVRVWRDDWAGDQFEVISRAAFGTFTNICERLTIAVEQADESD